MSTEVEATEIFMTKNVCVSDNNIINQLTNLFNSPLFPYIHINQTNDTTIEILKSPLAIDMWNIELMAAQNIHV